MIPAKYEKCLTLIRQVLTEVSGVRVTTDSFTPKKTENSLEDSGDYVTSFFKLRSALSPYSTMPIVHKSAILAEQMKEVIDEFHLKNKVVLGCFAHTINLLLQNKFKTIKK